MEINGGCHSCDLHQGFGSTTQPKENVVPNQAGGGEEDMWGEKKKKKESHIKLSICKKDKRNSFPLDTSQRPPARGRDLNFGSLFLNNQKEGASM